MEKYVIACDYYPYKKRVSPNGGGLVLTKELETKPQSKVYVRVIKGDELLLNLRAFAKKFENKDEAETLAKKFSKEYLEGRLECYVEVDE